MYMPKFELLSFASLSVQRKQIVLRAALEFLICADWNYILENPNLPSLYDYAPQYILKVRPAGLDAWQDIPQTVALGSGDCKDFACWRIAELRNQGYDDVYPHIKVSYHQDPRGVDPPMTVYHIQVRIHDVIEDPSAILGMPKSVTYDELRGDPTAASGRPANSNSAPPLAAGQFSAAGDFRSHGPLIYPPYAQQPYEPYPYGPMPSFANEALIIEG